MILYSEDRTNTLNISQKGKFIIDVIFCNQLHHRDSYGLPLTFPKKGDAELAKQIIKMLSDFSNFNFVNDKPKREFIQKVIDFLDKCDGYTLEDGI